MNKRKDQHVEDSLTFVKKDGQTQIRSENDLNTGTTNGMLLHHPSYETVWPKIFPVQNNYKYLNYEE